MKQGKTIQELAVEIKRQAAAKRDLIVAARGIQPITPPGLKLYTKDGAQEFGILPVAHQQLAEFTKVPRPYYDRMTAEAPALWQQNVAHWLEQSDKERMVRTLDGKVRAVLSGRYRRLDNDELAQAAFPALAEVGADVVSAEITDTRLYIKVVDSRLRGFIRRDGSHEFRRFTDEEMVFGAVISNSEVGYGRLRVETFCVRTVCSNGLIMETIFGRHHVGAGISAGDEAEEFFKDETRAASDRALFLQLRDTVAGALTPAAMQRSLAKLQGTVERKIQGDVPKAVEVAAKALDLTKEEGKSVLDHLIKGGDLTQWGLANAVTRTAEDAPTYDRASDLEAIGFKVIELKPEQWRLVAEAAA